MQNKIILGLQKTANWLTRYDIPKFALQNVIKRRETSAWQNVCNLFYGYEIKGRTHRAEQNYPRFTSNCKLVGEIWHSKVCPSKWHQTSRNVEKTAKLWGHFSMAKRLQFVLRIWDKRSNTSCRTKLSLVYKKLQTGWRDMTFQSLPFKMSSNVEKRRHGKTFAICFTDMR